MLIESIHLINHIFPESSHWFGTKVHISDYSRRSVTNGMWHIMRPGG